MKILIFVILFISTALPQSNMLLFFDSRVTTYAGGAKGDGVTDDFLALQTYINNNSTLDLTSAVGKTFLISQPLYPKSNTVWNLDPTTRILMMPGDSSMLTADYHKNINYCVVAEPSKFAVGQWVGIVDDEFDEGSYLRAQGQDYDALQRLEEIDRDRTPFEIESLFSSGNLLRYGFTDSIIRISYDTLFFAHTLNYGDTAKVSLNARVGHVQNCIIADGIDNWTLNGGIIDANGFSTNQIMVHPVYPYGGNGENLNAGVGVSVMGSTNIVLRNVSSINGITHNVVSASRWGLGVINTKDILFENVYCNKARMKNLWIRETDTVTVNVAICDSAIREDAIVGYTNVSVMTVDSAFITNWGRHGLLFNGNSGGRCDSLNATNIFLSSPSSITTSAITLKGTRAWVNGFTVTGGAANRNRIAVTNQYSGTRDIHLLNGTMTNVTDTAIISIRGDVGRVDFTNMVLNNCTGVAVYVDTFATGTPNVSYDGFPDTVTFTGGGIYNHAGYNFKYAQSVIADSTRFIFSNFCTTPHTVTAIARGGHSRYANVDLTWADSTASSMYYIYADTVTNPTVLIDSTINKNYTHLASTLTNTGYRMWYYRIKGRDNLYNYSGYSSTASDTVFEFETLRYLDGYAVHDTMKVKYNLFVNMIKDSIGIDSLAQFKDVIYLLAGSDSALSKINLVKGNLNKHNAVVFDTLTFTAFQGWKNIGTSGALNALNTSYNIATTDTVNFARHNFSVSHYSRSNVASSSSDYGVQNSSNLGLSCLPRLATDQWYARSISINNNIASAMTSSSGFFTINRTTSTSTTLYYKSAVKLSGTEPTGYATTLNYPIYILGINYQNTSITSQSSREISYWDIGRSLTATEERMMHNIVEWYMDSNGKGVE